jgi:hypothetical protein
MLVQTGGMWRGWVGADVQINVHTVQTGRDLPIADGKQ